MRNRSAFLALCAFVCGLVPGTAGAAAGHYDLPAILGYPYPSSLVAGDDGKSIAYVLDERGVRNVWAARAPDFVPHRVTSYDADDGQEILDLHVTGDGKRVVYVRGGDHDSNWPAALAPDPSANARQPLVQIWSAPFEGGAPKLLADGDAPLPSPDGMRVAFERDGAAWIVPVDGSSEAKRLFFDRGRVGELQWSPDGRALAFVTSRTDHGFVAIYRDDATPIEYLAPSTSNDTSPRWSPDGKHIAFLRLPGNGGAPQSPLKWNPIPWSIWVADVANAHGHRVWQSGESMRDSFPQNGGAPQLLWAGNDRLAFLSSADGWAHLYAVRTNGGGAKRLTSGAFMVEDLSVTPDGRHAIYSANAGTTEGDFDRRHLFAVDFTRDTIAPVVTGASSEWSPVVADGTIAYIHATASKPPLVAITALGSHAVRALDADRIPATFPASLVVPRSVSFRAADGTIAHGQIFERAGGSAHKPAVIFVHGGPPRQMLSTWHYMDYYSNAYAVNQYLADRGFVVLALNYRLGVGYGSAFNYPAHWGPTGASEYNDVVAAAHFLGRQPGVDGSRLGIWGGSYGGYLTALALARNSNLFKAGVDLHGVHDWSLPDGVWWDKGVERYQRIDIRGALKEAWFSSPDSAIATWRSPVLLIQGDDDRNVEFHQMVDLVERLRAAHKPFEELVIPNEIHGFLRYASWLEADTATTEYLTRQLHP